MTATGMREATVLAWDDVTGHNTVQLGDGTTIVNAPMLVDARTPAVGDKVALLHHGRSWFILGKLREGVTG